MAKWSGQIGFVRTVEDPVGSGNWVDKITLKRYKGDVTRVSQRWQSADKVNDDLTINNQLSIVANPYLLKNFDAIKFVKFMNSWWKVSSITMDYPRLTLEIGGVYNGETTPTSR